MVTGNLAMYEGVRGGRVQHLESGDNSSSLSMDRGMVEVVVVIVGRRRSRDVFFETI